LRCPAVWQPFFFRQVAIKMAAGYICMMGYSLPQLYFELVRAPKAPGRAHSTRKGA
jgi:hypothetical protein